MGTSLKQGVDRLPFLTKISYGCVGAANMLTSVITTSYISYFYMNALGFSASLAGTLSLIGSIWGWFCTPAAGAIIDKTGSKPGGKCRNYIKKFIIPGSVLLALCYAVPEMSHGLTVIWVMVTYLARVAVWSLVQLPATTLMGRITNSKEQRSHLNQFYSAMSTGGSLLGIGIALPLINSFGQDMNGWRTGFMVIGIIYSVVFMLLYLLAYVGTKGYEPEQEFFETEAFDGKKLEKPSVVQIIKGLITNKMCLIAVAMYLVDLIGCMIESNAMPFYYQYNLGNMGLLGLYSTLSVVGAYGAYFIAGFFVKKFGNSGTAMIGGTISAAAYLIRFIMQDSTTIQWGACVLISCFGAGLVANVSILCVFDSKVYSEWKLGVNNEGILMAAYSLGNTIGLALGRVAGTYLMGFVDYDPNVMEQSSSVLRLFLAESTVAPMIGFIGVILLAMVLRRFEVKIPQWEAELAERKGLEKTEKTE